MSTQPDTTSTDTSLEPIPRRLRERVAGSALRGVARVAGMRPELIPEHMRRQLRIFGVSDEQLARVLPNIRALGDWPYAWEDEGDARAARDDWYGAFASWYVGQRVLIAPSKLKSRLYRLAVDAYARIDQPELERIDVRNAAGERIAGYLQLPPRPRGPEPVPCILMLPGITGTKEELHPYLMPMLLRGFAVARIDHPIYGETEGLLDATTTRNARVVLDHLARDPRIDPGAIHVHGMSLGANFATQAAMGSVAASLTLICPPFQPSRYVTDLPTLNLLALQHMTRRRDIDDLVDFTRENDLETVVPQLTMPVRIFHGGRDRTIPVDDAHAFTAACSSPLALTIYDRDHHNCLEHVGEIIAQTLEFVTDPLGTCEQARQVERIDASASTQATDANARLAGAGFQPRRQLARLPFLLPWAQPRPARSAN